MKKAVRLVLAIVVCELAGIIGALFTTPSIPGWYAGLTKPPFNPPSWVFAPVWTALYALMGLAAWLVYEKGAKRPEVRKALMVFAVQLVLNTLWSIVFFGAHQLFGAVIVIVLLWAMILWTILLFRKISKAAAWLLAPLYPLGQLRHGPERIVRRPQPLRRGSSTRAPYSEAGSSSFDDRKMWLRMPSMAAKTSIPPATR